MSRAITVTLPTEKRRNVVEDLKQADGVVSIIVQPGASVKPPGDVLNISTTNEGMQAVLGLLARHDVGEHGSIETSEPRSLVSGTSQRQLDDESNEGSWPEIAALLRRDTNVTVNYLLSMFFAGFVAGVGLLTDMLHIVVGAMVLAPGFEPLVRIPFGFLGKSKRAWQQGLSSLLWGYLALLAGAAIALPLVEKVKPGAVELGGHPWVQYWSTISPTAPLLAVAAGAIGAAIISAQRSVLTTGVMITLALIPSMAVTGMSLVSLDFARAWDGFLRWTVDAVGVIVASTVVLLVKRKMARSRGEPGRVSLNR